MLALSAPNDFQDVFLQQENKKKSRRRFKRAYLKNKTFTWLSNKQQSFYGVIYYRQEDNLMF